MNNPLSILQNSFENPFVKFFFGLLALHTQREDTLHPCHIWDAILVSTSVGQLLRKNLVINSGIDYLPAGF
jgi:hypothetical protein